MVQPLSNTPGFVDPSKMHQRFVEEPEQKPENEPQEILAPQPDLPPVQAKTDNLPDEVPVPEERPIKAETDVKTPDAPQHIEYSGVSLDSVLTNLVAEPDDEDPFDALILPTQAPVPSETPSRSGKEVKTSVLRELTSTGNSGASSDLRKGIVQSAKALGIDPFVLATAISYETAGTFNPKKRGPRTKWGQHRGLIQFGEPQARQFGVDWNDPVRSQLGPSGAVVKYLKSKGVKPGMGLLEVYSAINAGGIGEKYYGRKDSHAGGAPGTVRQKVQNQMEGHKTKASRLLGL